MDEIATVARGLVAEGREVTVKAVAATMGLTSPALYRYVDGVGDLVGLVINSVLEELMGRLEAARDRYPRDAAAQIVGSATAFRAWSLAHPQEFRLVFASPPEPELDGADEPTCVVVPGVRDEAGQGRKGAQFGGFFGDLYLDLWRERPFAVASDDELDPAFVSLHATPVPEQVAVMEQIGPLALGVFWTFEVSWAKLFGIVALEVFGHVNPMLRDSGVLFASQMSEIGVSLGLRDQAERLGGIIRTESELAVR